LGGDYDLYLNGSNAGAAAAQVIEFDDVTIVDGFVGTAQALIHDASQTYMDAGADETWDNSSASVTTTGSPSITYNYADYASDQSWTAAQADSNASWSANETLAQLRAVPDTELRYRYFRVNISGDAVDSLDSFSINAAAPSNGTYGIFSSPFINPFEQRIFR
jgi:hypothetical protein